MKVGQQDDSSSHIHRTYVHSEHMSSKINRALNSHHVNIFQIVVNCNYKQQYVKILALLHSHYVIENVHSEIFNVFNLTINMLYLRTSNSKNSCQT